MTRHIGRRDVWSDPHAVARHLVERGEVFGLIDADVVIADTRFVCMWVTLEPWAPLAADGYPTERVAITTFHNGELRAVPVEAHQRQWAHRYPYEPLSLVHLGHLCLWYPSDPRELRWTWSDGFINYLTIVHRHLMAEEYWRRHGQWPAEDAPHGDGDHPIRDPKLRQIVTRAAA